MKKILLLIIMQALLFSLSAQNDIKWISFDNSKDKYDFKYFTRTDIQSPKAVFTIPHNKPFQQTKHSIFIRNYNSNLSEFNETGIPPESPVTVSIGSFHDYIVFYGSMDDNANPMSQYAKANRILITDNDMNPLVTKEYPLHGKRHKFTGSPDIFYSCDSTFLIVVNSEIQNSDKPSFKEAPVIHYIDIFDKNLSLVWSDSVDFNMVFGVTPNNDNLVVDYVNGKLVVIASCNAEKIKKIKPQLFIALFDRPQSYKIITKKDFIYEGFSYGTLITKEGKVYVSGLNMVTTVGTFIPQNKQLFFLSKDIINTNTEGLFKTYEIDKDFETEYADYKPWLKESIRGPFDLFLINGKIFYCSEHRYYVTSTSSSGSTSSTTYYFKHITLMCFDTDGQIEWLRMLNKNVASKAAYAEFFCQAYPYENGLCIFYYDYADNISSAKFADKPRVAIDDKLWVAKAVISPEGEINRSMITNIGAYKVRANLPKMERISGKQFLFVGRGSVLPKYNEQYYGFYNMD
ncbi:MAG: hypothetical protein WC401_00015 [Bacteroidales bacterium]|jgi:hypothetical protein|nr:hypothetical protein [Bacteroidales bacterium]